MDATRTALVTALATTITLGFAGTATANRGNDAETIRLLDDCEPKSFNAALFEGACIGDGDTTFAEFLEELEDGGDGHWRNNPRKTEVDAGEGLHLENLGGELHTFTPVEDLSLGGCLDDLNIPLGLPPNKPEVCAGAFTDPVFTLPPGAESNVPASLLHPGNNYFQCMIHPWMKTTVRVEGHHH